MLSKELVHAKGQTHLGTGATRSQMRARPSHLFGEMDSKQPTTLHGVHASRYTVRYRKTQ